MVRQYLTLHCTKNIGVRPPQGLQPHPSFCTSAYAKQHCKCIPELSGQQSLIRHHLRAQLLVLGNQLGSGCASAHPKAPVLDQGGFRRVHRQVAGGVQNALVSNCVGPHEPEHQHAASHCLCDFTYRATPTQNQEMSHAARRSEQMLTTSTSAAWIRSVLGTVQLQSVVSRVVCFGQ